MVTRGDTVTITLATARQWTGRIGQRNSEVHCRRGLHWQSFEVHQIHRAKHHTQVRVTCQETRYPVWINIWHRWNWNGDNTGAVWAKVQPWASHRTAGSHRASGSQIHRGPVGWYNEPFDQQPDRDPSMSSTSSEDPTANLEAPTAPSTTLH